MTMDHKSLDPIEEALLELDAAEKSQLFRRSRIDAKGILAQPVSAGSQRRALRLMSAAAVVAAAVCAWSWFYGGQWSELAGRVGPTHVAVEPASVGTGQFTECFQGPTGPIRSTCRQCDYDADGDVDLADFRAYQLAYGAATR